MGIFKLKSSEKSSSKPVGFEPLPIKEEVKTVFQAKKLSPEPIMRVNVVVLKPKTGIIKKLEKAHDKILFLRHEVGKFLKDRPKVSYNPVNVIKNIVNKIF